MSNRFVLCFFGISFVLASLSPSFADKTGAIKKLEAKPAKGRKTKRGFIKTHLEPAPGGAYLTVDVVQDRKDSRVKLILALYGTSHTPGTPNWTLTRGVPNPSGYHTRFQFFLDYAKLRELARSGGVTDPDTRIGSGKNLVVVAQFSGGHRWGGSDRNGIVMLPRPLSDPRLGVLAHHQEAGASQKLPGFGEGPRVTSLDVGQLIDGALAEEFAPLRGRGGLQVGGEIRSRVEAEGKFQLDEAEFTRARTQLFELAADPTRVKDLLGPEWTFTLIERYLKRDGKGRVKRDRDGFPIPDPMIDTYYDTRGLDAAQHDVAIRYRETKGNGKGTWNFKPADGRRSRDGIVYRVEYGVDAMDNRPESIAPFAESNHPLNPFQLLREIIPDANPAIFFEPSIRLTDHRYKFLLRHSTGVAIEVSLDSVKAERLGNSRGKKTVIFYQFEADVEHVGTAVTPSDSSPSVDSPTLSYATLHRPSDVNPRSPVLRAEEETFSLATEVIRRLRDEVVGTNWRPGSQKYAFAAAMLGAVPSARVSPSVQALGFRSGGCEGLAKLSRVKRD